MGATRSKATLQTKALEVIEFVAEHHCKGPNGVGHRDGETCFACLVFEIAHSANVRGCKHPKWIKATEDLHDVASKA